MQELFFYFLLVLIMTLMLAALIIRVPTRISVKVLALVLAAGLLSSGYLAGAALLGRPKPVRLAILERSVRELVVVASQNVEGKAIYLWVILPGETAPRAYSLPWSLKTAEALRRAQAEAERNGTNVRMRNPFRGTETSSKSPFYAPPPPPLPPKS